VSGTVSDWSIWEIPAKRVLHYGVQVVVAIVVGTIVGTCVGVGVRWLQGSEIDREAIISIVNASLSATSAVIIILTFIGAFPVRDKTKP